ncbi:MAG: hypothetical protein ACPGU7_03120 [Gammaproteobacteria bacterium]
MARAPDYRQAGTTRLWLKALSALLVMGVATGALYLGVPSEALPLYASVAGFIVSLIGIQYGLYLRSMRLLRPSGWLALAGLLLAFVWASWQMADIFKTNPRSWQQFMDPPSTLGPPGASYE